VISWESHMDRRLLGAVVALGLFIVMTVCFTLAVCGGVSSADVVEASGQPSPSLGATATPKPNPPGAQDSDPDDYGNAVWVVVAVAAVAVIIGAGTLWLVKSRRVDIDPLGPPDDQPPVADRNSDH
jgi:hypothetical protein